MRSRPLHLGSYFLAFGSFGSLPSGLAMLRFTCATISSLRHSFARAPSAALPFQVSSGVWGDRSDGLFVL